MQKNFIGNAAEHNGILILGKQEACKYKGDSGGK
jgi:hypothetical protein